MPCGSSGTMRSRNRQPFFLYVAYTAAHWPLHAPESEIAQLQAESTTADTGRFGAPASSGLRQMGIIHPDWDLSPQDGDWSKVRDKPWEARCMEVYAAQVDRMDQGVGKIVADIDQAQNARRHPGLVLAGQRGLHRGHRSFGEENRPDAAHARAGRTWISYGQAWANTSNTPLRYYKHFVHEGGISTPLIAHWPAGIKRRGKLEHQPGHLIDIMTTCVDLAGAKYPVHVPRAAIPAHGRPQPGSGLQRPD